MNLYLISQSVNTSYDTYDSAVVCAESEEEARKIHPDGSLMSWEYSEDDPIADNFYKFRSWCSLPSLVQVKYLGELDNEQIDGLVICASFHTG